MNIHNMFIIDIWIETLKPYQTALVSAAVCEQICLTLLHSERPKLYRVLAVLSAIGLSEDEKNINP